MTGTVRVPLSRDSVPLRTKATGQDTCCLGGVPVSRCPVCEGLRRPVSRCEVTA